MSGRPLATAERVAWLRLARTPRVGPLTFQRLLRRFGSAEAALAALPRLSRGALTPLSAAAAEDELARLAALGARLLCVGEPDYPPLLAQVDPPPPVIAARGRLALLRQPIVALVGAREASAAGLTLARALASGLGAAGYVVASGLARGIDAAAHAASLETGSIAVLAGGLDNPYPPQNAALHEALCERGVVLSEAPLGCQARARDFPRRNHIISGLAFAVVVVEAALRSGSLITARAAAEQGREVMAAPGSPLDPRARGANALIRDGATLVETADDILAALGRRPRAAAPAQDPALFDLPEPLTPADAADLVEAAARLLSPTPMHIDALARALGAPAGHVAAALMELELAGRAATLPGGYGASSAAAFPRDA